MVKSTTLNFLVPSLHPNTLVDLAFPEPTLGLVPVGKDPIVQHLPVKYGTFNPLGCAKRIVRTGDDQIVIADDKFQVSTLDLSAIETDEPAPPVVTRQDSVKGRSKDLWAGLVSVQGGTISALTSGLLTHHTLPSEGAGEGSSSSPNPASRAVPSPLQCLASSPLAPTSFALGGKEVDISIWDMERTFGSSGATEKIWADSGKRKKNVLEHGQMWQAKNVPQNNLSLRQPIHHLSLAYLPHSPHLLVSGTKQGTVRRFDSRQRKPLSDWKVAREGGVGCVAPGLEHELFFADRTNLVGSLDLRTGKVLYTYPSTSTAFHLLPLPLSGSGSGSGSTESEPGTRRVGLGSISNDATFRLHTTTTPPSASGSGGAGAGNWGGQGKKGEVLAMSGGVGVGSGIFRGYSQREIVPKVSLEAQQDGAGAGALEAAEESDDEQVWQGLDEVADTGKVGSDSESDWDSDSGSEGEADRVVIKSKPKKKRVL